MHGYLFIMLAGVGKTRSDDVNTYTEIPKPVPATTTSHYTVSCGCGECGLDGDRNWDWTLRRHDGVCSPDIPKRGSSYGKNVVMTIVHNFLDRLPHKRNAGQHGQARHRHVGGDHSRCSLGDRVLPGGAGLGDSGPVSGGHPDCISTMQPSRSTARKSVSERSCIPRPATPTTSYAPPGDAMPSRRRPARDGPGRTPATGGPPARDIPPPALPVAHPPLGQPCSGSQRALPRGAGRPPTPCTAYAGTAWGRRGPDGPAAPSATPSASAYRGSSTGTPATRVLEKIHDGTNYPTPCQACSGSSPTRPSPQPTTPPSGPCAN